VSSADPLPSGPSDPAAHQHHINLAAARCFQQFLPCGSLHHRNQLHGFAVMVQPRRAAYSRMARLCMGSVC
jgi:hypothetical protein